MTKSKGIKPPDWNWTVEHEATLRSRYATMKKKDLVILIGCTIAQITYKANAMGIKTPPGATRKGERLSAEQREKIKQGMLVASAEGRIQRPQQYVIEAMLSKARSPSACAKRSARAAETMRGIPQRMDGLSAAAEHNARAKTYTVLDPLGQTHTFTNLSHFVRENGSFFSTNDTIWKGPEGNPWCRAQRGLEGLFKSKPNKSWKGWCAVSKFHNVPLG